MNPQGYEHDHVIPTNIEDVAKVLQAAAHSASCTAGLLMVSSATGWEQLVSSGQSLPKADEAWLRMISSYGDVVLVGQDSPANTMETNSSGSTLIYVAIRGFRHELLGAMLLRNSDQAMVLSAAQRYALQAQAAHIRTYLQPGRDPEANNPLVTSFERLRLLESVVINANDAILITEAEPIDLPGPRIVYCNPAFLAITGFTEEEVIGRTPRILQCEETSRATLDVIREALSHWRAVEVELLNTRKDGSKFWVELSIVPVANEKAGSPTGCPCSAISPSARSLSNWLSEPVWSGRKSLRYRAGWRSANAFPKS